MHQGSSRIKKNRLRENGGSPGQSTSDRKGTKRTDGKQT